MQIYFCVFFADVKKLKQMSHYVKTDNPAVTLSLFYSAEVA